MNKSQKRRSGKIVKSGRRSRSRGRSGTRSRSSSSGRSGTIVRINNIDLEVGNEYEFLDGNRYRYRCTGINERSDTYSFDMYSNDVRYRDIVMGETTMNKNTLTRELRAKIERIRAE